MIQKVNIPGKIKLELKMKITLISLRHFYFVNVERTFTSCHEKRFSTKFAWKSILKKSNMSLIFFDNLTDSVR